MNATTLHRAIVLALAPFALAACGGGGGGMVRSPAPQSPPPPAPPPSPPPATAEAFCPAPITSDCIPDLPYTLTFDENQMKGGRDSDFSLRIRENFLTLLGDYRFGAGTTIEDGGALIVDGVLRSDAIVGGGGELWLRGTLRGNLTNGGRVLVGQTKLDPQSWQTTNRSRIEGDFTQQAGTLSATLSMPLQIMGRMRIEGGTLELRSPVTTSGSLVLPPSTSHQILHADGGVTGTFERWTSPGLFIDGALRYEANDVWFDLVRISVQAAMAGQGFGGLTLASAGNLDGALARVDGDAALPRTSLDPDRQRFLASAGRLLWQGDARQAARSLDSIAGHGHMQLAQAQYALAGQAGAGIAMHAARLQPGTAGAWSETATYAGAGVETDGYDRWLGPRLLVGGGTSEGGDALGFDQLGGHATGRDRQASLYLHHRGDRWQATAVAMAGRSRRLLQREIELDDGRQHLATAQRSLSLAGIHGEVARPIPVAGGSLQPFVALDYTALHSARFGEAGDTGFELVADEASMQRFDASLGARYQHRWQWHGGWLDLHATWQVSQALARDGAMPAAFVGAPQALFDLAALEAPGRPQFARIGLDGGFGNGWRWSLQGMRAHERRGTQAWQLRFARDF